jgi:hypothetical protein
MQNAQYKGQKVTRKKDFSRVLFCCMSGVSVLLSCVYSFVYAQDAPAAPAAPAAKVEVRAPSGNTAIADTVTLDFKDADINHILKNSFL